jgi:hypothetical protein
MGPNPSGPAPPEGPPARSGEPPAGAAGERYGTVTVERRRKDDGRQLIIYARDPRLEEQGAA